jgi:hypothetical protein
LGAGIGTGTEKQGHTGLGGRQVLYTGQPVMLTTVSYGQFGLKPAEGGTYGPTCLPLLWPDQIHPSDSTQAHMNTHTHTHTHTHTQRERERDRDRERARERERERRGERKGDSCKDSVFINEGTILS